ncbi:hypothetical protein AVEN_205111-1 [Araneus ventricosus]|uniref:Uncharacterized protein n=1 Tax=Araneus ventricosus TaxID=182803 RepID=A0A4Y2NCJ8_ARAVE|nr:hypothetical protein AVEN_205111-1 [Araneus ventricosus]
MDLDIQVVGFLLSTVGREASFKRRNADYCSVFRSEIIAIDMALDLFWNINYSLRYGFSRTAEVFSNILIIGEMLVTGGEWISLTNSEPCAILVFFIYNGYYHM